MLNALDPLCSSRHTCVRIEHKTLCLLRHVERFDSRFSTLIWLAFDSFTKAETMVDPENSSPKPETINKLRFAVDGAFAMLAGMQLDLFTPLKNGPMTADNMANAIGVGAPRLRLLLYALVANGLLTEKDGRFSNTAEADRFLVKGSPSYMGNMQTVLPHRWPRQ